MVLAPASLSAGATPSAVVAAWRRRRNSSLCSHVSFAVAKEFGHSCAAAAVAGRSRAVAADTSVSPVRGGVGGLALVDCSGAETPRLAAGRIVGLEACEVLGSGIAMGAGATAAARELRRGIGMVRPVTLRPPAAPDALNVDVRFV